MVAKGYLEGISIRTRKVDLLQRLKELAGLLEDGDKAKLSKLQEVEARIRAKRDSQPHNLRSVIVTCTAEEFQETVEFLAEFDDLLPVALARLNEGGALAAAEYREDQAADDPDDDPDDV